MEGSARKKDFMSPEAVEEFRRETAKQSQREKHGLAVKGPVDSAHDAKVEEYVSERRTWRASVPVLRTLEYWQLRADYYPYIGQSDKFDDFFIRGTSCHPRLSEYPMCKNVIRDYFQCRDRNRFMQLLNACSPLREQMGACINVCFVRNHQRGDKKFNEQRERFFDEQHEKKISRLMAHAAETHTQKEKLAD